MKTIILFCALFSTLFMLHSSPALAKTKNKSNAKKVCLESNPQMKGKELKDCMNQQKKSSKKKAKKK
ncbi:MAG: hypothetical protein JNM93_04280 [Bacteriovoracaceae bacterium]|nr:hypothetical protein [Bacteriovoracaceae bacterium]